MNEIYAQALTEYANTDTIPPELVEKLTHELQNGHLDSDELPVAQMILESCQPKEQMYEPGDPAVFGESFHNPYTFVPFASTSMDRKPPTPLTIDEIEKERITGVLDLEIELCSPLLAKDADGKFVENTKHLKYEAATIGEDVILPATGIRGALRTLLTLLTGGTLGHVDEEAWLCQGRDNYLGGCKPRNGEPLGPKKQFLAEVMKPGKMGRAGTLRLGTTRLVLVKDLEGLLSSQGKGRLDDRRPKPGKEEESLKREVFWVNENITAYSDKATDECCWRVKLSGQPVGKNEKKQEGLFKPSETKLQIPWPKWCAYTGRHRFGDHPELFPGDLVWLEPADKNAVELKDASDVASIQWARWGKEGVRLLDLLSKHHHHVLPDSINPDGLVDEVTNLFGQVPRTDLVDEVADFTDWKENRKPGPAYAFAARVRSGNLVFANAKSKLVEETLPVLNSPKPGCVAFYRWDGSGDPATLHNRISRDREYGLRGYKVYRTSSERGQKAPWRYSTQPSTQANGSSDPNPYQKTNCTVQLLPEDCGVTGKLRLTFRALSKREISLLLAACSVDWRLGGGKPFGLGHCRIRSAFLRELTDSGQLNTLAEIQSGNVPEIYQKEWDPTLLKQMKIWRAVQQPVENLRYPRAAQRNNNQVQRGGHIWFTRHTSPKKNNSGLQGKYVAKNAAAPLTNKKPIRGQILPEFNEYSPDSDVLYGYDVITKEHKEDVNISGKFVQENVISEVKPFIEEHSDKTHHRGDNLGQNRELRQRERERRR